MQGNKRDLTAIKDETTGGWIYNKRLSIIQT